MGESIGGIQAEEEWLPVADGTKLYLRRWMIPQVDRKQKSIAAVLRRGRPRQSQRIRGILHIIHGMAEYGERYYPLAQRLCEQGIVVWAADMRGHGRTADPAYNDPGLGGQLGHCRDQDAIVTIISDIHQIILHGKEIYPDLPVFLLGHSWGSFLAQAYMQAHGEELAGCMLSGSRGPGGLKMLFARPILMGIAALSGSRKASALSYMLVDGPYSASFKPKRTFFDWLSRDAEMVDNYIADPLCGYRCSSGFYRDLIRLLRQIHKPQALAKIPQNLPIYVFSGNADPVGEMGTSPTKLVEALKKRQVTDLEFVLYPGARHETLNETNRDEVMNDLIDWIDRHCAVNGKS